MAGNALGKYFRITTFGESHGPAVGVLIDGVRPNMRISIPEIQRELNRRRPGQSRVTTTRNEPDTVEILSGVFNNRTLGTPICLLIRNRDQNPAAYKRMKDLLRPGHAGYTYLQKYGIQDYRGGGRSSGRETAGRVAAGAIAKQILARRGISITAYTLQVGTIRATKIDLREIENNPVRCPDPAAAKAMIRKILRVSREGDSIGGIVEAVVRNCPAGLGDPVFDKLEADLAKALLSIPALKGVEIGSGFSCAVMRGSEHNDEFYRDRSSGKVRTKTNRAGGILGGISTGEDIVVRVAVKPPSSIPKRQRTVDVKGRNRTITVEGRHDPCLCPRIVPVVESMIGAVLVDHLMRQHFLRGTKGPDKICQEIDLIDDMIMLLLARRREIAVPDRKSGSRGTMPDRASERAILRKRLILAAASGLDPVFITAVYRAILEDVQNIYE